MRLGPSPMEAIGILKLKPEIHKLDLAEKI
jgi:hypothetical protein